MSSGASARPQTPANRSTPRGALPVPWPQLSRGRRGWLLDLAALGAGIALALAFAPFEQRYLAVLAPAVLFLSWSHARPARAFWRGFLFGLGLFLFGVSWVYESIHQFGQVITALSAFITVGFAALLATFIGMTGLVSVRLAPRAPPLLRLAVIVPALWVLGEWLRGWLFTGFPWLYLAHTQVDSPLRFYAPWGGWMAVSLAAAITAGLFAWGLYRRRWAVPGAVTLAVVLYAAAAALAEHVPVRPDGPNLSVSLIQGNVPQVQKQDPNELPVILARYYQLTRSEFGQDVIVWPESAIPEVDSRVRRYYLEPLDEQLRDAQSALALGIFRARLDEGIFFNSMIGLGLAAGHYDKRHLVPFGEYFPLRDWLERFPELVDLPGVDLSHGPDRQALMRMGEFPVGVSICYEGAYAGQVRDALPEAAWLVNASDDTWFGDSFAPHQHLEIARLRSVETGRYLLRAANTGISAIVAPDGSVRARLGLFETGTVRGEVTPMTGATAYVRLGDAPVLAGLALLVLLGTLGGRLGAARKAPALASDDARASARRDEGRQGSGSGSGSGSG